MRLEFNVNLHLHADVVVGDEEHCRGSCAHHTGGKRWKVSSCSCGLGSAVVFSGHRVLVMDKQREGLWKAACENGSALVLTGLGVTCRRASPFLPSLLLLPSCPVVPAVCAGRLVSAIPPSLPKGLSTSWLVSSVLLYPPPLFFYTFAHSRCF